MRTPIRMLVFGALLALTGCQKPANDPNRQPPSSRRPTMEPVDAGVAADAGAPARREAEEACVDGWLQKNKLDAYGSEQGTMYAGGTPLFDERTGETKDRLEFVYARHPAARAACRDAAP